jgi:hypothetical protein
MGKKNKNRGRQFPGAGQQGRPQSGETATATVPLKEPTSTPIKGEDVKLPISTPKVEVPTKQKLEQKAPQVLKSLADLKKVATPVAATTQRKPIPEGVPSGNPTYPFTGVVTEKTTSGGFRVMSGPRNVFLSQIAIPRGAEVKIGDVIHFEESILEGHGPKIAKYLLTSVNLSGMLDNLHTLSEAYKVRTYTENQLLQKASELTGTAEERLVQIASGAAVLRFTTGKNQTVIYAFVTETTETTDTVTTSATTGNNNQ